MKLEDDLAGSDSNEPGSSEDLVKRVYLVAKKVAGRRLRGSRYEGEIDDVAQQTALEFLDKLNRGFRIRNVDKWAAVVAWYRVSDVSSRANRQAQIAEVEALSGIDHSGDAQQLIERRELVITMLSKLNARDRGLAIAIGEGLTTEEYAEKIGVPCRTMEKRRARLLDKLRPIANRLIGSVLALCA